MEPDQFVKVIDNYKELLAGMLVISQKQLNLAKSTDMDEQNLAEFNQFTEERQVLIDQLDALTVSIDDIRQSDKHKSEAEVIEQMVKAIVDNDKESDSLMRQKLSEVAAKLNEVRKSKQANKAYGPAGGLEDPWFLDMKK